MPLEGEQALFEFAEGEKVIRREGLVLHDGEVGLDLIEPARMHRSMYGDEVGPGPLQALDTASTSMRAAVVHDPEHARRAAIGSANHDLCHQATEGGNVAVLVAVPCAAVAALFAAHPGRGVK